MNHILNLISTVGQSPPAGRSGEGGFEALRCRVRADTEAGLACDRERIKTWYHSMKAGVGYVADQTMDNRDE